MIFSSNLFLPGEDHSVALPIMRGPVYLMRGPVYLQPADSSNLDVRCRYPTSLEQFELSSARQVISVPAEQSREVS